MPDHQAPPPAASPAPAPPLAPPPRRRLLVLRFGVLNAAGFALLAAVWLQGWLQPLFEADSLTHMCKLIFAFFLLGLARAGREAWRLSAALDELDRGGPGAAAARAPALAYLAAAAARPDPASRATLADAMRLRLAHEVAPVRHAASRLVLLGIIGTILGFIIALYGGVDPAAVADVAAVGPMVATVLQGVGMAFFKTLTGSVLNLWLTANYRLLEDATVRLAARLAELGEGHDATA